MPRQRTHHDARLADISKKNGAGKSPYPVLLNVFVSLSSKELIDITRPIQPCL
jgi:hypothetical protein